MLIFPAFIIKRPVADTALAKHSEKGDIKGSSCHFKGLLIMLKLGLERSTIFL